MRRRLAVTAVIGSLMFASDAGAAAAPRSVELCRPSDQRIDEASGIAQGIRSPGVFYVQNDSGDSARFFAINTHDCTTAAAVRVDGAHNVDWEDLAVAPDAAGAPSVWLADIGDNDAKRSEIDIYRVDEPHVDAHATDVHLDVHVGDEWRLRYPTGPVNAESFAVTPDGTAYVITKSLVGLSTVYRLPSTPSTMKVQPLVQVGTVGFSLTGTHNPFGAAGELTATGAAVSPDGALLAVRTYSDAYLWRIRDGDIAGAIRARPTRIALPEQPQGEGIAFFGTGPSRLVLDSEQRGSAVDSVAIPPVRAAPATSSTSASTSSPAKNASPSRSPSRSPSGSASAAASTGHGAGGWGAGLIVLIVLGLFVVLGAAFWIAQLTGNRRGR